MPDPIVFDTTTPRFGLPMLFAGQAQKEAYVNEAHARADALLHCAVLGERSAPPADPADGSAWLVGENPSGDWQDRGGDIACRQSGNWLFIVPQEGMRVYDVTTGQTVLFAQGWQRTASPANPVGGTTIDQEARAAIEQLLDALRTVGVLPET